ncbi:MAG: hypothetical protein WA347_06350 [Rhabdochlamydiaceae bacterium]
MSIQFPFHKKTETNSPITQSFSPPSHFSISQNFQQIYTKSSIISLSSSRSCQWLTNLIKRCFPCFFSKSKSQSTSSMLSVSSTTSTNIPTLPMTTTSAEVATSSAEAATSSSTVLPGETLQGRIALAKNVVEEHLFRDDFTRRGVIDQSRHPNERGVIIRLHYNGQEAVIKKNWADANLRDFIGNRVEAFLSDETNRDHSDGALSIHTIFFQKRGASALITYDNPFCTIHFPGGRMVSGREHDSDYPLAFKAAVANFIRDDRHRADARNFIDNLVARQNSDAGYTETT